MSDGSPDFGPRGYLPDRAARRARKIVLRAPLGLQWVLGAVAAGLVVVVAGVVFLQRAGDAPGPPWEAFGPADAVGDAEAAPGMLLVGAGGRIRAFAVDEPAAVRWCPTSRRLESVDGAVWSVTGRGLAGVASLSEYPTLVVDGTLYIDRTTTVAGPPTSDEPAEAVCR